MKTKKLTLKELLKAIDEHNEANKVESQFSDKNPLWCVVVFKNESWPHRNRNYTLKERSYKFRSDNKRFLPKMCGTSIFAECLDDYRFIFKGPRGTMLGNVRKSNTSQ